MRTFILAVTGFALGVSACSSYGTSVLEIKKTRAAVASVSVTLPRSLVAGQTARAVATVKDASGASLADRGLVWYTSQAAIASVSDSGMVSAVAPGNAVLSAVSEGVAGQATVAVIAPPPTPTPVATVLVAITPASVMIGQKARATATPEDAKGNPLTGRPVTWQSSNTGIASVVPTGDVTAVGAGTATITATSEGQTGLAALTVTIPSPIPVASVSVSPATATLQVGGTVQLAAATRDANNNLLIGRTVTWTSGNTSIATVSALGLVTAIASGPAQISASSEGQMASAAITVTASPPPPAPVASISVLPATATLQVGDTLRFSAVTRDANNNVLTGRAIVWSSGNTTVATMSASGLVTAKTAGPSQITASSEGKTGNASLQVNPAPPPPPGGGGWRGHEPSGMTLIADQSFTSLPSNGWSTAYTWGIVQDATAPQSPGSVLEFQFPAGFTSGVSPGSAWVDVPSYRQIYLSTWIKYSSNWQGERTSMNKIMYLWHGQTGGHTVIRTEGVGNGPLLAGVYLQGVAWSGTGTDPATGVYTSSVEITRGQWHLIEVIATSNTGNNRDGSVSLYVDGVLAIAAPGIEFEPGGPLWNIVAEQPVWGGGGDTVTSGMSLRVDQTYVSGKN